MEETGALAPASGLWPFSQPRAWTEACQALSCPPRQQTGHGMDKPMTNMCLCTTVLHGHQIHRDRRPPGASLT